MFKPYDPEGLHAERAVRDERDAVEGPRAVHGLQQRALGGEARAGGSLRTVVRKAKGTSRRQNATTMVIQTCSKTERSCQLAFLRLLRACLLTSAARARLKVAAASAPEPPVVVTEKWRAKHDADYRRDWVTIAGLHPLKAGRQHRRQRARRTTSCSPESTPPSLGRFVLTRRRRCASSRRAASPLLLKDKPVTDPIGLEGRRRARARMSSSSGTCGWSCTSAARIARCACAIRTARSRKGFSDSPGFRSTSQYPRRRHASSRTPNRSR